MCGVQPPLPALESLTQNPHCFKILTGSGSGPAADSSCSATQPQASGAVSIFIVAIGCIVVPHAI